jgi:hypothetical protein
MEEKRKYNCNDADGMPVIIASIKLLNSDSSFDVPSIEEVNRIFGYSSD